MRPTQRDPWHDLSETLAGRFTARARGLLASDFALLDSEGEEVGRLEVNGTTGAKLSAGDVEARIERAGRSGYKMLSHNAEILTSTDDTTSPRITYQNHPYETTLSLLRNKAEAGPPEHTTIRINGGLTNRNYTAIFDPHDRGSPPVALFLLYRLVSLRREAYRT
jgi:hypothetical protein